MLLSATSGLSSPTTASGSNPRGSRGSSRVGGSGKDGRARIDDLPPNLEAPNVGIPRAGLATTRETNHRRLVGVSGSAPFALDPDVRMRRVGDGAEVAFDDSTVVGRRQGMFRADMTNAAPQPPPRRRLQQFDVRQGDG